MKQTFYERIGESVYREVLPNGLQVCVVPKPEHAKKYAFFATRYGGMDTRFCLDGKWLDTPAGIAHYLEHKMFDTKEGNALQELAANGASPNAFTSNAITGYYFESTEKFEENLRILLSFVSIPYFTKESVDKEQGIIGIAGVDTRRLTRIIRESGVMNGALTTEYKSADAVRADAALMEKIKAYTVKDAVDSVTTKCMETFNENGKYHVALFDFGYKRNILRNLVKRGCKVTLVPGRTTAAELAALEVDGVMLSNGPGDPAENVKIIENLKEIAALGRPVFGICLGHQLMALATGAKTEKLKYGHRGVNQPVTDFAKDRTFITSQNHGYAVVAGTVDPAVAEVSHVNANDGTTEGIRYKNIPCFTVQFHPEACGGPRDTEYLFDDFVAMMKGGC